MKKAWIVQGGWDGHEPELVSKRFAGILRGEGFEVEVFDTLTVLEERREELHEIDLLVPAWTMGTIERGQSRAVVEAVGKYGVGLAGCHGGMCDSFREDTEWQFIQRRVCLYGGASLHREHILLHDAEGNAHEEPAFQ